MVYLVVSEIFLQFKCNESKALIKKIIEICHYIIAIIAIIEILDFINKHFLERNLVNKKQEAVASRGSETI